MNKQKTFSLSLLDELHTNGIGHDVLRYIVLPDLLGAESDSLLYFMGRKLARNFNLQTTEDIYYFFEKMGWGQLELVKEKRNEFIFQLMSDAVASRIQASIESEFRLEAGFLAEAMQIIQECDCECAEEISRKIGMVSFKIVYEK